MPDSPRISYYLSYPENPVLKDSPTWQQPLPLTRCPSENSLKEKADALFTYADYFRVGRMFIEYNGYEAVIQALRKGFQKDIQPKDIEEIRLILQKHGEFYHPSLIEVIVQGKKFSFVLNVAISEAGKAFIKKEFCHLKKLNDESAHRYLPQVYHLGDVEIKGQMKICMFLGQWFEAYSEFHICAKNLDPNDKILVWDSKSGRYFLSVDQTRELYKQAAKILTYFYNLETFDQIFAWHHAAGDFVVKIENEQLDVKLITVRGYGSVFKKDDNDTSNHAKNAEMILHAMLVFFLNLSIRMRLDRRDGVGDIVWANDAAVWGSLEGVFDGLAMKPQIPTLPDTPLNCFRYYLSASTESDLFELCTALLNRLNPISPEYPVISRHLKDHVYTLYQAIQHPNAPCL